MISCEKSRDLPLSSFYSILQLEWLCYHLRRKTYKKDFSKNYDKICETKREKILGVSTKNLLPSIFSDKNQLDKYINILIPDFGIPDFQYRNDEIKQKMRKWDIYYYFSKGVSVKFLDNERLLVGIIFNNELSNDVLEIFCQETNKIHYIHNSHVSRIFSQDFFHILN